MNPNWIALRNSSDSNPCVLFFADMKASGHVQKNISPISTNDFRLGCSKLLLISKYTTVVVCERRTTGRRDVDVAMNYVKKRR